MTTFDTRGKAFEGKFAQDQETAFKVVSRRNRLLGEWAGQKLGKSGEALQAYVLEVMRSDLELPGDDDVRAKVQGDLTGVASEDEVRAQMQALLEAARVHVENARQA